MSLQTWEELLYSHVVDATQISNTVSETIMIPDFVLPAKYWYAGRTLKVTLVGVMSNVVTTPGTLTIRSRLGGVAGTSLCASAALALNTTAQTNASICIEFWHVCRIAGLSATSGTMFTTGRVALGNSRSTQGLIDMAPATGNAAVASLDLTSATTMSYTAQFSVSTNPTNLTINIATIEAMN